MDWSPVLTVVATGLVALGTVWLNGRASQRSDERKIAAEEAREIERTRREDAAADQARANIESAKAEALAENIASQFLDELQAVRGQHVNVDGHFNAWFDARWKTSGDIALRRSIGGVVDSEDRTRLLQLLEALDDYYGLAMWDFEEEKVKVEQLLSLGFDLSSTMARGQEPDTDLTTRFEKFQKDVQDHDAYEAKKRDEKMELWRQESAERKQKKGEGESALSPASD